MGAGCFSRARADAPVLLCEYLRHFCALAVPPPRTDWNLSPMRSAAAVDGSRRVRVEFGKVVQPCTHLPDTHTHSNQVCVAT